MSTRVLLQIGERNFQTTKETLADGSEYFRQLFSNTWKKTPDDKPIYVDTDPDAFVHVLRYLRLAVFPLLYDEMKGHDYTMYGLILEEAKIFGINALVKWLEGEQYYEAMEKDYFRTGPDKNALIKVDSSIAVLRPTKDVCAEYREVWHCPNALRGYFDNLACCGRRCGPELEDEENVEQSSDSEGGALPEYRKRVAIKHYDLLEMKTYNHRACLDQPSQGSKPYQELDDGKQDRKKRRLRDPFKVFPKALKQPAFPTNRPRGHPLRHWGMIETIHCVCPRGRQNYSLNGQRQRVRKNCCDATLRSDQTVLCQGHKQSSYS